jgi:hypothetical protein
MALHVYCSIVTVRLCAILGSYFPDELESMQKAERDVGIYPEDYMGGIEGASSSMDISVTLANASHYDVGDASLGVATWTELYPGMATNVS